MCRKFNTLVIDQQIQVNLRLTLFGSFEVKEIGGISSSNYHMVPHFMLQAQVSHGSNFCALPEAVNRLDNQPWDLLNVLLSDKSTKHVRLNDNTTRQGVEDRVAPGNGTWSIGICQKGQRAKPHYLNLRLDDNAFLRYD